MFYFNMILVDQLQERNVYFLLNSGNWTIHMDVEPIYQVYMTLLKRLLKIIFCNKYPH